MFVVVLAAVAPSHDLTHTPTPSACRIFSIDRCYLSWDGKFLPPINLHYAAFALLFQLVSPTPFVSHENPVFTRLCSVLKGLESKSSSKDRGFRTFYTPTKELVKEMIKADDIVGEVERLFYVVYCALREMRDDAHLTEYMGLALHKFYEGQFARQLKSQVSMHSVAQCRHVFLFAMF